MRRRKLGAYLGTIAAVSFVALSTCSPAPAPTAHLIPPQSVERAPVISSTTTIDYPRVAAMVASRSARRTISPRVTAAAAPQPAVAARGGSTARASWYAAGLANPDAYTFASRTLGRGTQVRFCHAGRCVVAVDNDYGPASWTGRQFDLSRGAFAAIAALDSGVITVTWSVVG